MIWQPIHTAPVDGTLILLYRPDAYSWAKVDLAKWDKDRFAKNPRPYWYSLLYLGKTEMRNWHPTHWQPLPDHPPLPEEAP